MTDEALEPRPELPPLLALQELDLSIDRLRARVEELEGGEEVRAARRRADDLEEQLGTLRLALDSVVREQKRLDAEVDSFTRRIEAEERRLFDGSVANPKELQAIRAEVENLRNRRTRAEDEELEQMERREELEGRARGLEAELAEARDRLSEIQGTSAEDLREVSAALEARRAERAATAPLVDEETLELYEDLRGSKKGIGAAALEGRVCMACRQQLSPLEFEQVRKVQGTRRCPNCRRILVFT